MTCTLLQDWDLLELEHGCIVDRNACIFCHVGIFRNGTFIIDQVRPHAQPCGCTVPLTTCCDASSAHGHSRSSQLRSISGGNWTVACFADSASQ